MKGEEAGARWKHHMMRGDFERAWRISDYVLNQRKAQPRPQAPDAAELCLWRGEDLDDKCVLICCHHGIGYTIQFIRFATLVRQRARRVVVVTQPELLELLRMVDGIDLVVPLGDVRLIDDFDVAVEVMELPHLFRTTIQNIPADCPYIHVPSRRWSDPRTLNVGLVWKSGEWDDRRSIHGSLTAPLHEIPGVTLHILQRGAGLREHPPGFGVSSGSDDVVELAEIMKGLDLVISVDTMPAHLAGALAVPTWTLLHPECDWRWMHERSDSPWYPTMRLFRQKRLGDWKPLIERVTRELEQLVRQREHQVASRALTGSALRNRRDELVSSH
jgi:hypothetical protein